MFEGWDEMSDLLELFYVVETLLAFPWEPIRYDAGIWPFL